MPKQQRNNPYVSSTFKIWLAAIVFFLTFIQLYTNLLHPQSTIVSNEIILGVVLVLMGYLWIQELRDRYRLHSINVALTDTQSQLERAEIESIAALILTEEARDPYVRGHSKRVTRCALEIAAELGLSNEEIMVIERAAILHDLGKLSISDSILRKPGKLNEEEWAEIKKHPRRAAEILEPLKFLAKEKEMVVHHHERYDGKGYPDELSGEDIPLGSRILAVADSFDAMNSKRSYRKPLPEEVILCELRNGSGTQLDPLVVTALLGLLKRKPSLWERL